MRKFKEVKRKEVIYDTKEWAEVERKASSVSMNTSEYIRRISLDGKIVYLDMNDIGTLLSSVKIIGKNINQITKKTNEINSIYAEDLEKLREENYELCLILPITHPIENSPFPLQKLKNKVLRKSRNTLFLFSSAIIRNRRSDICKILHERLLCVPKHTNKIII